MLEPTGHCPYLGLKQNQAIRFASPTPEHRCYATGQAQEIPSTPPEYQINFCLSADHIRCPLYTGMVLPSTPVPVSAPPIEPALASVGGLRGWLAGLPARDRAIYGMLLTLLGVILVVYAVAGVGLIREGAFSGGPPSAPTSTEEAGPGVLAPPPAATATRTATPTPTTRPSSTPTPSATPTASVLPTIEPIAPSPEPPTAPPIYIPPPAAPTNTPGPLTPITPEAPTATEVVEPPPTPPPAEIPPETPGLFPSEAPTTAPVELPTPPFSEAPTTAPTEAPASASPEPPTAGPPPSPARTPGP